MSWTFVTEDIKGKALGEVRNATDRTLSIGINRPATSGFTIRPDNELMGSLFNEDTLLKVYEDNILRFRGNVTSSEFATSDDGASSIRVNAADPAWKLTKRLLGLSSTGTTYTGEKAKSARKMINELNTDAATYPTNPHTGIKLLAEAAYVSGSGTYVAGPYAAALSCINDLAHNLTGFDWYMKPIEGEFFGGGWVGPLVAQFEATNAFGVKSSAVFEHGFGTHNVNSQNFTRDLSDMCNMAFHLPDDGFTEGGTVKNYFDNPTQTARGRYEQVADAFGLTDEALRKAWLEEFIRVKKNPRQVVTMTLDTDDGTGRVPKLGTDYWLGDMVQARAVVEGTTLYNGQVRVYGVNIAVNEAGTGIVTPVLVDEEGEAL